MLVLDEKEKLASHITQIDSQLDVPPILIPTGMQDIYFQEYYLPMQKDNTKKTLVLDLDETLVHSSLQEIPDASIILPVYF